MPDMQPENGQYKLSVEQRLTRLETVVDEIKNNHLVHLETKLNWAVGLLIANMGGIIVSFIK